MYQHTVTLRSIDNPEEKRRVVIRCWENGYTSVVFWVRKEYPDLMKTHEIRGVRSIEVR